MFAISSLQYTANDSETIKALEEALDHIKYDFREFCFNRFQTVENLRIAYRALRKDFTQEYIEWYEKNLPDLIEIKEDPFEKGIQFLCNLVMDHPLTYMSDEDIKQYAISLRDHVSKMQGLPYDDPTEQIIEALLVTDQDVLWANFDVFGFCPNQIALRYFHKSLEESHS